MAKSHSTVLKLGVLLLVLSVHDTHAAGIVQSVVKAPIVPDGNVRGAVTDVVINFDTSLDPVVAGRPLTAGCSIRVTLPDSFINSGLPVQDVFSSPTCAPGNFQCITAVLLQGWPQHPIFPLNPPPPPLGPANIYSLGLEGPNTLVFTALVDIVAPNPLPAPGPGIKQIHLINGFLNPSRPGLYPVDVEVETGPSCDTTETGTGRVRILSRIRPSINFTSVFNGPGNPNAIYQQTSPGAETDLPYNLLLWDRRGDPLDGVTVQMVNPNSDDSDSDGTLALLRRGRRTVGHIRIDAPPGAEGQEVFVQEPSFEIAAPISGVPTARSIVFFRAGSETGDYVLTFKLNGGNSLQAFVRVE